MKRIIIFDDSPSSDGFFEEGVGAIISGIYTFCAIAAWPFAIKKIISTEDAEERRMLLLIVSIVLIVCVCIAIIYNFIKNRWRVTVSNVFLMMLVFTTIVSSAVISYICSFEEAITAKDFLLMLLGTSFFAGAPSLLASGCVE